MDGGTMTDRKNNRASEYGLALVFSPDITLRRFNEIIERLEDEGIDLDYASLEISSDTTKCSLSTAMMPASTLLMISLNPSPRLSFSF